MGFIGLVGEPGIMGEKVSVRHRGKPSELAFFHQERSQWASELWRLHHLPLVLASFALQKPMSLSPRVLVFTHKHNQTLVWPSVDVCAWGCLLATPSSHSSVWGNSSVDSAPSASVAPGSSI